MLVSAKLDGLLPTVVACGGKTGDEAEPIAGGEQKPGDRRTAARFENLMVMLCAHMMPNRHRVFMNSLSRSVIPMLLGASIGGLESMNAVTNPVMVMMERDLGESATRNPERAYGAQAC